ncbi:hypothetical protein Scep_019540 [Stephania cephalantha]|uniref:Uncharacterized protein n=1 Tax=Stephania cephalantha TaxID=152367 RepID=A0AAP0IBZ0_9MAGN
MAIPATRRWRGCGDDDERRGSSGQRRTRRWHSCEGRRRAAARGTPARSREGTTVRRRGDSAAATVSGSTGEGLAGFRHGGAYQQCAVATADQRDAKELTDDAAMRRHGGGALPDRLIPDETQQQSGHWVVTSTKLDDAMDCSRRM